MNAVLGKKDAEKTRRILLEAAFDEIYREGFRKASLDNILKNTGVTKGALYHHFPNKNALGYAVVEELIWPHFEDDWKAIKFAEGDPTEAIVTALEHRTQSRAPIDLRCGCPVNNLVQEMSGIDDGFRERLCRIQNNWIDALETALRNGQQRGFVRPEIDPVSTAWLLVASFEGCAGIAKVTQSEEIFLSAMRALIDFVKSLRTDNQ